MTIGQFKTRFDTRLASECQRRSEMFRRLVDDKVLASYVDHAVAITLNGGKRLRPYLVNLMRRTAGGSPVRTSHTAEIAVELFHMALLIHDDIMDNGTLRHNLPSTHVYIEQDLKRRRKFKDATHVGVAQAISIGDLFVNWTAELLYNTNNRRAYEIWNQTYNEVVAGQLLDVDATTHDKLDTPAIERKTALKTARYSFVGPMKIGSAIAQSRSWDGFIEKFGTLIGTAYQIQDDLFDWTGGEQTKTAFSDISRRQHTIIRNYIITQGTGFDRKLLARLESDKKPNHDQLLHLIKKTGAFDYAVNRIDELFAQANFLLLKQTLTPSIQREWQALLSAIKHRDH